MDSDIRASGEHLYLTLLEYDSTTLVPEFLRIMHTFCTADARLQTATRAMLECQQIDGLWLAAGLDTFLLKEHMNYGNWFLERVVPIISTAVNSGAADAAMSNARLNSNGAAPATASAPACWGTCLHPSTSAPVSLAVGVLRTSYRTACMLHCTKLLLDFVHAADVVTILGAINALKSMIDNCGFGVRDSFTTKPGGRVLLLPCTVYLVQCGRSRVQD